MPCVLRPLCSSSPTVTTVVLRDFRSDDYLCLHGNPAIEASIARLLNEWEAAGTQARVASSGSLEAVLRRTSADFLGVENSMFFPPTLLTGGGLFGTLVDERDVIVVDDLVHGPVLEGVARSPAFRRPYRHRSMADLSSALDSSMNARRRLIVTEGVFGVDGSVAPLPEIVVLAEQFDALLMVDDTHGLGVHGPSGAGTVELFDVVDKVDVLVGTYNAEIGGGYASGKMEIVEALQRAAREAVKNPQTMAPTLIAATLAGLEYVALGTEVRKLLRSRAQQLRQALTEVGFPVSSGDHPIVAVTIGDAQLAQQVVESMFDDGILVTAFAAPVVPIDQAIIRLQVSVNHTDADITACVDGLHSAVAAL